MPSPNDRRAPAPEPAQVKPAPEGKHVIGIDLGTSRGCVAYAVAPLEQSDHLYNKGTRPTPVKVYCGWIGSYENGQKNPPTSLYYKQQGGEPLTGHALDRILRARRKFGEAAFDTDRLFRLWKLMFHDHQNDQATKELQEEMLQKLGRLNKTPIDLLRDWVAATYRQLLVKGIDGQYRFDCGDDHIVDLEIVVAVPPGRSVIAHEQVHQAFIQGPIKGHQVCLVSEPEAMFRSWVADGVDTQDWKVGAVYLVADGGAGTSCLVRFRLDRLDPLGFTQEFDSESIVCGAETISNSFEKLAATKVPLDLPKRAYVLDQLRRQFDDVYKLHFGSEYEEDIISFEKRWDPTSEIEFTREQIASCFDGCISKLVNGIQRQLRRSYSGLSSSQGCSAQRTPGEPSSLYDGADNRNEKTPVDYLVLGGGLFENPYVMKTISKTFPSLKVRKLSGDKGHVARGAVLTRLHARNDFIQRRPIMRSKAVVTWMSMDQSTRNSPLYPLLETYTDERNRVQYFYVAQWLVKQGDEAGLKYAEEIYEIASESSFQNARTRPINRKNKGMKFTEEILTINYHPGDAKWALFRKGDNKLMDQHGNLIPDCENSETVTWDLEKCRLPVEDLQLKRPRSARQSPYWNLHYSIQMQLREVGTTYWIKAWSKDQREFFSEATEREALFKPQEISQSLADSRRLGSGIRSEDDLKEALDLSIELQEQESQDLGARWPSVPPSLVEDPSPQLLSTRIDQNSTTASLKEHTSGLNTGVPDRGVQIMKKTASTILPNSRKRCALFPDVHQSPRVFSRGSLLAARPTQQQATDGMEYILGERRNNGGCWTCLFRKRKCDLEEPECSECARLGLGCEYGCPSWWYDENLKSEQKMINKRLIGEYPARTELTKGHSSQQTGIRPKNMTTLLQPTTEIAKEIKPVDIPGVDAHKSRQFQPHMVAVAEGSRLHSLPRVSTKTTTSQQYPELDYYWAPSTDLYSASPPRRRHPRELEDME